MCSVLSVVGLSSVDYLLKIIDKEALLDKLEAFFRSREKNIYEIFYRRNKYGETLKRGREYSD